MINKDKKFQIVPPLYLIFNDLKVILEHIEPTDDNLEVYSHRIYALLLRTCTEFEQNCKSALSEIGHSGNPDNWTILDFYSLNGSQKLSEYEIKLDFWQPDPKVIKPFDDWKTATSPQSLSWYQSYNNVKHNRNNNFHEASLHNLLQAISGLYALVFSIVREDAYSQYQEYMGGDTSDSEGFSYPVSAQIPMSIKGPENF